MGVLEEILGVKRDEVTVLHRPETQDLLRTTALAAPPTRDFTGALRRQDGKLAVIAEMKRRSPSKGPLAPDLDAAVTAKEYERGGASAISVLTDRAFFGGTVEDLQTASAAVQLPILRKDFTIDPVQVYETRAIGADAILLILSALPDDGHVRDLQELGWSLGLAVLVEAHDPAEVDRAVALEARIVGVNARNLSTFNEHLDLVADLSARIPPGVTAVAESAIRSPEDARRMAAAGFDAVLVGEALVRAEDPAQLVGALGDVLVNERGGSA
ncbi:MAG: indole-3-glycerol phosphate synthase TrpC [Acidimicrobiia bacterium]